MNKYIVAYISLFDNDLIQTLVEATSERDAMLKYLAEKRDINFEEDTLLGMESANQVIDVCLDMDSSISVYKLE